MKIIGICCGAFWSIGSIILIVGLYYWMIKAGIPYQDPTPEMTAQYMRYFNRGEFLTLRGFIIQCVSAVLLLILAIIKYKGLKKKNQ